MLLEGLPAPGSGRLRQAPAAVRIAPWVHLPVHTEEPRSPGAQPTSQPGSWGCSRGAHVARETQVVSGF